MITLRSHPKVKASCWFWHKLNILSWLRESMYFNSLVNHENWYPCVMIHYRSYPVCITYTSALTMGNSSWQPRQIILSIRRWCATVSNRFPKSMNQLWTTYLLTKNPWLVFFLQLLMHSNHVQCKRHGLNAQINVNTPKW